MKRIQNHVNILFRFAANQYVRWSLRRRALSRQLTGHDTGDVGDDDGLPEHSSVEDVPDGSVGRFPHLLQLELCSIGGGGAEK